MILPYKMETTFARYPFTNAAIIAVTSIFHFLVQSDIVPSETSEAMVLQDWNMGQLVGSIFLHGGFEHLLGNMLFLWIFGNAVCALVGNLSYIFIYIFLGICASFSHMLFSGYPAIGASGAINGVVGLTLIFFPINKLHNFYFLPWPFSFPDAFKAGKFVLKSFWMILLWFVYDILGVAGDPDGVGHWAHIGGFAAGIMMGVILMTLKVFETYDATILDVISGNVIEREELGLDELKNKDRKYKPKLDEEFSNIPSPEESAVEHVPIPVSVEEQPVDVNPIFRVLKLGRKDGEVFCYFINAGDKIVNPSVETPYVSEIQPAILEKNAPGWIRFTTYDEIQLEHLQLTLSFDAGPNRLQKQMAYNTEAKKFITV